jgi:hypothetical protein
MRKKKTPVGLLVTLGVLITGALAYNAAQSGLFRNIGGSKDPVGDARKTDKDYGASVANKAAASAAQMKEKANQSKAPAIASFRKSLNGKPLMAMAKATDYKPTPNESSTSTQWYH